MGIVTEDIAHVRAMTDMLALVGEYTPLKRVGSRYVGLCPFHAERSGSFSLNAEEGLYYCFGCQASGDAITFLRAIEGCDFVEAVERLAARAGITVRHDSTGHSSAERDRLQALKDAVKKAADYYHERLLADPGAGPARQYLRSRGYDGDIVRRFRLGWAPGADLLVRVLGLPAGLAVKSGLAREAGRGLLDVFSDRIIFPIFDPSGSAIALGGRLLPGHSNGRGAPAGPKYRNSSDSPLYSKRRTLYGLNWARQAIVKTGCVVVCEGYTDVIGLFKAGVPQAVATCGTALTEDHFKVLGRFARRVVLAFDADSAGQSAAERIYEWERRNEIEVAVASLPPGSDPAELAESDPAGLNKAVETALPFLSFRLERALRPERLHSAESRAKAAEDGVEMIAEHPNELVRDQYVMVVSDRTMIESDRLRERVERARRTRAARVSKGAGGGGQAAGGRAGSGQTGSGQTGSGQTGSGQAVPGPGESARVQETNALSARRGPAPGRRAGRDALVLAIHDRSSMQGRLGAALFSDPVQRRAFAALDEASDLHSALEIADDEAADLLRQLAVGEPSADSDQTIVALARSAATASLRELEGRARQAEAVSDKEGLSEAAAMIRWLKQELEAMAEPGVNDLPPRDVIEAADRLVAWLSARGGEPT